jgi:hypothetical protein
MVTRGFEECSLLLTLEQSALAQGEALQGNFRLETVKEFSVRGIIIQLVQVEDVGARDNEEVVARERLAGPVTFSLHETFSSGFVLALPLHAPPTAHSPHCSLGWRVEAILDRPMRTDFSIGKEVYVYVPA